MIRSLAAGALLLAGLADPRPAPALSIEAGATPQHAIAADFDADGRLDIAVATVFDDTVSFHFQSAPGVFTPGQRISVGRNTNPAFFTDAPRYLEVVDINRDGAPDVLVLTSGNATFGGEPGLQVLMNLGNGTFTPLAAEPVGAAPAANAAFPVQMVVGNFVGDHYADVALATAGAPSVTILRGDGTGRFQNPVIVPLPVPANAGPQDLAVGPAVGTSSQVLVAVAGNAAFVITFRQSNEPPVVRALPLGSLAVDLRAVAIDDVTGDGRMDAVFAAANNRVIVLPDFLANVSPAPIVYTHPSLSGCSDVVTLDWDGDARTDIAITNRTSSTVTVFHASGMVSVLPASQAPRRLFAADMNGDGRRDLLVAAEGDQVVASNADVTLIGAPPLTVADQVMPQQVSAISGAFSRQLAHARAMKFDGDGDEYWTTTRNGRAVVQVRLDGRTRTIIPTGFPVGGVCVAIDRRVMAVDRFANRIVRVSGTGGPAEITFSHDPGPLGWCGITWDPVEQEYLIAAPSRSQVVRVATNGTIRGPISLPVAAWDIHIEPVSRLLYTTNPGRTDIRVYTPGGLLDPIASFDLAQRGAYFRNSGIAGISVSLNPRQLNILTTSGLIVRMTPQGLTQQWGSLRAGNSILGADIDEEGEKLFVLGVDAHVYTVRLDATSSDDRLRPIGLLPAILSMPDFVPGGVCLGEGGIVLVADERTGRLARFSDSGNFLGFEAPLPSTATLGPVRGIARDRQRNTVVYRGEVNAMAGPNTVPWLPMSPSGDLAASDGRLLTTTANESILLLTPRTSAGTGSVLQLPGGSRTTGLAFRSSSLFVRLADSSTGLTLETYLLATMTAAGDLWSQYE